MLLLGLSLSALGGVAVGALGFIVALGLAIFVHELGHFLAAKAFGVPVERFVIGMDDKAFPFLPKCFWEKQIGETTYGLSYVPLGGYVAMSGYLHPDVEKYLDGDSDQSAGVKSTEMRPDGPAPKSSSGDGGSLSGQAMQDMAALYQKPFWQKFIIYSAGVFMNLVLAMVIYGLMYTVGFSSSAPLPLEVSWLPEDNRFAQTEIQSGDKILEVEGAAVADTEEFWTKISTLLNVEEEELPDSLTFLMKRGGSSETYQWTVSLDDFRTADFADIIRRPAFIEAVIPNDPADDAGMKAGDLVLAINGEPIADWTQFRTIVSSAPEEPLEMEVQRDGETLSLTITPIENPERPGAGLIGVIPGNPNRVFQQENVVTAFANAPVRVVDLTNRYVANLGRLFGNLTEGNVSSVQRELGGPVGIAQIAYRQAQSGFTDWLRFVIILNVALAVMNILPYPVLDGGHIVFAAYEAIVRKPIPGYILVPIVNFGVYTILLFFLLVTANDILKLFT